MLLETYTGEFISVSRRLLESCDRQTLVSYLEARGSACYEHESTSLLRQAAIQDWDLEAYTGEDLIFSADPF